MPTDESEKHIEGLRTRVRTLLESGELSLMGDYDRCLEPLGMDVSEFAAPAANRQGQTDTVFEAWIDGFPLFQPLGTVSDPPPGQEPNPPSVFNPGRWFGWKRFQVM